jgi:hypothetical protein
MMQWRQMGKEEFNRMAFNLTRAHFNKQADMHLSAALLRHDAQGQIVTRPNTTFMCGCVACEVFDLKNPKVRENKNFSRPDDDTIGAYKKVVLPAKYLSGSPFGEPTSDLEGLLKIIHGPDFRVGAPPPRRSQTEKDHATDAGQNRATALRKDRLQNERDASSLAGLRSAWTAVPNLRSDDEARDLLGVPSASAGRGAGRQAQYGETFEQALRPENTRQPPRHGALPANLHLPPSPAIDSPAARSSTHRSSPVAAKHRASQVAAPHAAPDGRTARRQGVDHALRGSWRAPGRDAEAAAESALHERRQLCAWSGTRRNRRRGLVAGLRREAGEVGGGGGRSRARRKPHARHRRRDRFDGRGGHIGHIGRRGGHGLLRRHWDRGTAPTERRRRAARHSG